MDEDRGREEGVLSRQLAEAAPGPPGDGGILCVCVCVCRGGYLKPTHFTTTLVNELSEYAV